MAKLRITEVFYSLQGEGLYTGTPSVFIRTFGCNFKCRGFGMPKGKLSDEYKSVRIDKISDLKDVPLVETGCDSYASWWPQAKHLTRDLTPAEIVDEVKNVIPNDNLKGIDVILTGGEPLLGWQKVWPKVFHALANHLEMREITFETNGTQPLRAELFAHLQWASDDRFYNTLFSVSPKLSTSGEPWDKAIRPDVVFGEEGYHKVGRVTLKFVISDSSHLQEVEKVLQEYGRARGEPIPPQIVYLMPEGGTTTNYFNNARRVAELALSKGWNYSPRLQVDLFSNGWGT